MPRLGLICLLIIMALYGIVGSADPTAAQSTREEQLREARQLRASARRFRHATSGSPLADQWLDAVADDLDAEAREIEERLRINKPTDKAPLIVLPEIEVVPEYAPVEEESQSDTIRLPEVEIELAPDPETELGNSSCLMIEEVERISESHPNPYCRVFTSEYIGYRQRQARGDDSPSMVPIIADAARRARQGVIDNCEVSLCN